MRVSRVRALARIVSFLGFAAAAYGQAVLTPITTPATVGTTVVVTGTGFPTGAIANTSVKVTITPPPGNGAPVVTQSVGVVAVGTQRLISFTIPGGLVVNSPIVSSVAVSGTTGSGNAYTTTTPASLTINPPATLTNISPGAGTVNTSVTAMIAGSFTHFSNTSTITVSGTGVTAVNNGATSTQLLKATFTIAAGATPGARDVTIKSGNETATIVGGFIASVSPGLSFSSITLNFGTLGQTLNVTVTGTNTHFVQAATFANFGDGITVNSLSNFTPTSFVANITVSDTTYLGWRTVFAVTGGEYAVSFFSQGVPQGFEVVANVATQLVSIAPNSAPQATNLTNVAVTGLNTHFLQNATTLSMGAGINVGNIQVNSQTSLTANVAVGPAATVGAHDITVTTGGETETLAGAFTVTSSTPFLSNVTPTSGAQGAIVSIAVTGVNTNFMVGNITADFGSNITTTVNPVNATSLTISASIGLLANAGGRTAILHDNGTDFDFAFSVTPSPAQIISVNPTSGPQGGSLTTTITGQNTHWVQGTTTASITCCVPGYAVTVNRITVNSPTSAVLDLTIPAGDPAGAYSLTMATGGEVVSSVFSVSAATPTLSVAPGSGMIGTTIPVVSLTGQFTNWAQGTTTLNIDGEGIAISNFQVTSPVTATATFVIDPTAPVSNCGIPVNCRTITVTTGNEIVTTTFAVTSTPAVIASISPDDSPRSSALSVTITGQYTHFVQGTTTLNFGPDVTPGPLTVDSVRQTVTTTLTVDGAAAYGWRTVYVNTGAEQLQAGFLIDSPVPTLSGIVNLSGGGIAAAHGFQGETVTGVEIIGLNTHWSNNTQLILGAGITINSLSIDPVSQTMTANVVISPTAPIGGNVFVAITQLASGPEVAIGTGVLVLQGPAQILTVTPSLVTQNQTVTMTLVGQATHWLQGGTVPNFGPGVVADQFTIIDATHATAQITVLSQATTGFHSITLTTSGENAFIGQGFDVEQGTPTLLSSVPNTGMQGVTENIQVLGQFTHWVQGITQAQYTPGVTVNSVTVMDSVTATVNITVDPLAYVDYCAPEPFCRPLTMTTATEQVTLPWQFSVTPGPAQIISLSPNSTPQGSTITVHVIGLNTHFVDGLTTANFGSGVNVSTVSVSSPTTADVTIAATVNAPTGFVNVTLSTLGENASIQNAFTITPGVPTLNGVSPVSAEQGVTTTLHILSQFTHLVQGTTTATFGQGITLNSLTIDGGQTAPDQAADANITIDPLAYTGGRTVTFTTGGEIVSGNFFSVVPGPAIISGISPSAGNQGQEKIVAITGQGTHWLQSLTQFSIAGAGSDITVNAFIVNSPTSATADITISPTAGLGPRSIYISTAGEVLTDSGAFLVTGGIPSITYLSPGSGTQGSQNLAVTINGIYTQWTASSVVNLGPGVTILNTTWDSSTAITAIVNIDPGATPGFNTVTVTTGPQVLLGSFQILDSRTGGSGGCTQFCQTTPYISYFNPSVGLPGQTFDVNIQGQFTNWDTTTHITFGAGVAVNTFQTVTPTSALANITIDPAATQGTRTVTLTTATNGEIDTASFNVVFATPVISVVDPSSALQGEPGKLINIIGQYTTWDNTTVFNFGAGVHVSGTTVLGPTVATVTVSVDQLATLGGRAVTATTGAHVDNGGGFSVTPSLANISSVTPNTALQNDTPTVSVVGQFTHWDATTVFTFGGGGITVTGKTFVDVTHYTLTLALAPLATLGTQSLTATTNGEVATLVNAFVVQPGTPLILSSGPPSIEQQNSLNATIIGQFTQWAQGSTTVSFGAGSGIQVNTIVVTGTEAITANITAAATTPLGYRNLYVTTGGQTLTLPSAIYVTGGPAAVTQLNPNQGPQGATAYSVAILGTNTNFLNGVTTANFGPGVGVTTLTVADPTHATASVNIASNATPGLNSVTLTTLGETAVDSNAFQIIAATPVLLSVSPGSGAQGDNNDSIAIIGGFTHFQQGKTTASFGAGTTANVTVTDATHATVSLNISPIAVTGSRAVNLTTDLGGGNSEIAVWSNSFQINPGSAAISLLNPNSGYQNQNTLQITITGTGTHFDNTSTVSFGQGITPTVYSGVTPTSITATINIDPAATVGTRTVTVTTGGENASIANGFTVNAGLPVVTTITANTAHQGDTLNVQLTGLYTTFQQGTTTASFGAGITVNGAVTVTDATHATANITIAPGAVVGARTVTLTTGAQVASDVGGFTVIAGLPQLTSLNPNFGSQNSTVTLIVNGMYTNFQQGVSQVTISGGGASFGTVTVNGPATLSVPVTLAAGATLGQRTVTVTTGSELATSSTVLFTVQAGLNVITGISPNTAVPSQVVPVTITGQGTNWTQGTTVVSIAPDLQVGGAPAGALGPVTVNSPTSLTASVIIPANAPLGPRNVSVQTGAQVQTVINGFTVQLNDTTVPTVTSTSPAANATSVSLNTAISVTFSKPINPATLLTNATTTLSPGNVDVVLYDTTTGQFIGGAITLDASGRIGTFVPSQLLAVNRQYQFVLNGGGPGVITDTVTPTANTLTEYSFYFTTGFNTVTTGPSFVTSNIYNGDTGIATNTPVVLQFSTPVNPVTQPQGILVQTGSPAVNVPGVYSFNGDNTIVTFTPSGTFNASAVYTVLYTAQLTDSADNPLENPGSFSFTTGTAADNGPGPVVVSYSPPNNETNVPANVALNVRFNKAVNPLSVTPGYFYLVNANTGILVPSTISFSPDRLTATLTPKSPLTPFDEYYSYIYNYTFTDLAGNQGSYYSACGYYYNVCYFTTGAGTDNTAPSVTTISPTDAITGVAVNAQVVAVMSKPIDATSVNNSSIALTPTAPAGPAVTGTVTLASDQVTLTFVPSTLLSASTTYAVQVSGFRGVDGTAATTFNSTFATSALSTPDTTAPSVTSYTPASGSTQPENTTITLNINKPMNPASFFSNTSSQYSNSFAVLSSYNGVQTNVTGTVAVTNTPTTSTVVFMPSSPLTAGATINVYTSYWVCAYDFAGNCLTGASWSFTVTGAADTTPPTVTSITPPNGTTGVGQNTPVVITFSKPLNPNTINANTFGVFNGDTQVGTSITRSADGTTVTLTQTLPPSSLINIVITQGVTDLVGNKLADYTSQFTTAAVPPTNSPSIVSVRPGYGATGVDPASPITLISNRPLNPATVPGALHVSQNGVIVAGSLQYSSNNQTVLFTPGAPFTSGALVQIFFDATATDSFGNALNAYNAQFTVAPALTGVGPTVSTFSPAYGTISISNPVVDIQFTKPINAATVTTSTVFLMQNDSVPVPATVTLFSPTVVRIQPSSPLPTTGGPLYRINILPAVQDTQGNAYTGPTASYYFYMSSSATPDNVNPIVTALAPPNGSTSVGDNALFRIQFSKPIDPTTVTQNTILISGGGYTAMPSSIGFDGTNQTVTITPQVPLPDGVSMTIAINGVTDPSGNAVVPFTATFTTANGPDTTQPYVVSTSVSNGDTNIPVNSSFTVVFSKPMDTRLLNGTNFSLYDQSFGTYLPVSLSFSPDGTTGTINPTSALPVGRAIQLGIYNGQDVTGNTMIGKSVSFTTSFTANTTPPAVTYTSPFSGATGVPINTQIQVLFTEPVQATSLSQVTLTGGPALTTTLALSSGDEVLTLLPNTLLQGNTTYTLTVTGVKDISGNPMTAPVTATFTTAPGADLSATVTVSSSSPGGGETNVGTNVAVTARFNKPINPIPIITGGSFYLVNSNTGIAIPSTISFSADRLAATLTPKAALAAFTQYYYRVYPFTDLVGDTGYYYSSCGGYYCYFTTGTGTDNTAPTVTTISPTDAITGVAVNAQVVAVMSKPIDATSVNNSSITLTPTAPAGPAVTGTVTLASDQVTLTFVPSSLLSASTTYAVQVSGFRGVDGTAATAFNSTFVTGASSTPDTTDPSVTSYTPASGSTQPENTTITLNINKPMNPASFVSNASSSFLSSPSVVSNINGLQTVVVGSVTVTNTVAGSTVVFTPSSPLTAGASISVCATCSVDPTDFAGNGLLGGASWSFTVTGAADTAPPTVTSITPPNGTTGVGQNTPVVITFSKPLNPNTINNNTFGVFNGDTQIGTSITRSADGTTVTLTQTLPPSSLINIVITQGVTDLVGNKLADYTSQFTTAAVPPTNSPSIVSVRPGYGATGVDPASPITLISNRPLNPATVPGALHVSQNGVIVAGSLQYSSNNQTVVFTPGAPFTSGALVQIFFDATATDSFGNALNAYNAQFTVAPALTGVGPTVSTFSPAYGTISISNPVVDVQFTKPIDPATVTTSTVFLMQNNSVPVSATVTLFSPTVARIQPSSPLPGGSSYWINILPAVQDTEGNAYTGPTAGYYFSVSSSATPDNVNPIVTALAPPNGSTGVGDNALFRIQFSKPIDPTTVTQNTILIGGGGYTAMPSSIGFDGTNQTVTITPQAPLPDGASMTIAINGVTDPSGNAVVPVTAAFTTANGPDTTQPYVVSTSVSNGDTNIPVNSSFTVVFSKPMDTRLLNGTNFSLYDQSFGTYLPVSLSFSPDGTTGTINPTSALPVGRAIQLGIYNGQDVTGNTMIGKSVSFTTSFTANTTPPAVTYTSPFSGATGVPINTQIQVLFTEPVQATSLSQVTLTGGPALTTTLALSSGDEVLTLLPNTLLQGNTTYTLTVTGVKDISGNPMTAPVTATFTTGSGADLSATVTVSSSSPGGGETNVGTNVAVTARFNKPINPIPIITGGSFYLVNSNTGIAIPSTISFSADRLAATLTPKAALAAFTQYYYRVYPFTDLVGDTGYYYSSCGNYYCYFTTGAGTDNAAPTVTTISPTDAITGVAVNAQVVAVMSKPIDATSVNNSSITLTPTAPAGPAVTGTVTLASDQVTLTFVPSSLLSASTTYAVQVSGFRGVDGTAATTFNSTFATGIVSTPDTTNPTITSYTPASGSTQPENTTITLNINKPMNPASFFSNTSSQYSNSFAVLSSYNGVQTNVTGTIAVTNTPTTSTVVFTPFSPLTAGATISVYPSYWVCAYDFAGNCLTYTSWSFTVTGAADTTPPTVTSITPPNGTTGVGQNTPVVITFSKPLNPNTINNNTFAMFSGGTQIGIGITRSADNSSVTLTATFVPSTVMTAAIASGVTDLSGNALAPFTSQFTTAAVPPGNSFSVITQRPGNGSTGVPVNTPIYLVTNRAVNPSTAQGALHVSQNGVIVAGTASVSANGEAILFTPSTSFANNSVIQVFLDSTATDNYGNQVNAYSGEFTTASPTPNLATVGPTVTAISPPQTYISITNPVVDIQFTKPIAAASVSAANFFLLRNDGGSPIPATVSQPLPNLVRIAPTAPLDPTNQPYYRINISASVQDTDGNSYTGPTASYLFYVYSTAVADTTAPTITGLAPAQGWTVGDNALINLTFSKPMDPVSINASTVTLNGGAIPVSFSFNNNNTNVVVTPLAPLADSANFTLTLTGGVNGIIDPSENAIATQTVNFSTQNGPDVSQPYVVSSSVDSYQTVPQNTVFSVRFNKPMNTQSLVYNQGFYLYDFSSGYVPVSTSFSADGMTATLSPTSPLTAGHELEFVVYYGQDLSGNSQVNYIDYVYASSSSVTTAPAVLATNPGIGQTSAVPINTQLQVLFNESLQNLSLSQITLTGGPAITLTPSLTNGDQTVLLVPNAVLAPNTTYTLTIQGVLSTSGIAMSAPVTVTFTTGSGATLVGPTVTSVNPLNNSTGVAAAVTPTVTFSSPINSLTTYSYVYLRLSSTNAVIPATLSYSADYQTVTITPNSPLSSGTQYNIYVDGSNITDEAGNANQTSATGYNFTTQ